MSKRVAGLPRGRRDTEHPRKLITGPLTALIIGVAAVAVAVVVLALLAVMGGADPRDVQEALLRLLEDLSSPSGWVAALLSSGGLWAAIRRIAPRDGALERAAGATNGRLDNLAQAILALESRLAEDRREAREMDKHRGQQIAGLRQALAATPPPPPEVEAALERDEEEDFLEVDAEPAPPPPVVAPLSGRRIAARTPPGDEWPIQPSEDARRRAREQWERIVRGQTYNPDQEDP